MIVVTGAAGRLGRRVVQLLVDRGKDVLATDQVEADGPASGIRALRSRELRCGARCSQGRRGRHPHGGYPRPVAGGAKGHLREQHASRLQRHDVGGGAGPAPGGILLQRLRHGMGTRRQRFRAAIPAPGRGAPHDALRALRPHQAGRRGHRQDDRPPTPAPRWSACVSPTSRCRGWWRSSRGPRLRRRTR